CTARWLTDTTAEDRLAMPKRPNSWTRLLRPPREEAKRLSARDAPSAMAMLPDQPQGVRVGRNVAPGELAGPGRHAVQPFEARLLHPLGRARIIAGDIIV